MREELLDNPNLKLVVSILFFFWEITIHMRAC